MAHFAEIDKDNKVIRVLVIDNEFENDGEKYLAETIGLGGTWIQTSYNSKIRGKYAGIGDTYDEEKDIFISPIPVYVVDDEILDNEIEADEALAE